MNPRNRFTRVDEFLPTWRRWVNPPRWVKWRVVHHINTSTRVKAKNSLCLSWDRERNTCGRESETKDFQTRHAILISHINTHDFLTRVKLKTFDPGQTLHINTHLIIRGEGLFFKTAKEGVNYAFLNFSRWEEFKTNVTFHKTLHFCFMMINDQFWAKDSPKPWITPPPHRPYYYGRESTYW